MNEFLDEPRAIREGEELDVTKLEPYLLEHLPGAAPPLVVEQFPSGHSNLTYSIRLGQQEYVLRRPPFGSKVKSAHDMGREYRVLSKLCRVYPPAPQPLMYCDDESIFGAPFYVMKRITGVILRKKLPPGLELPPDTVRRLSRSFIDNLALLHGLDYEAIGLGDLGRPAGYVERQVNGWMKRYAGSQTHDLAHVEEAGRWFVDHVPSESSASLVHNDYKYDNVVLDPDDITRIKGVLDWEMCTLGDPLMDLGNALGYWVDPDDSPARQMLLWGPTALPGSLRRKDLIERYAEQSGRDTSNMLFYYAFALYRGGVILQQIYYRYHHGLTKDERFAPMIDAAQVLFTSAHDTIESGRM